MTSSTGIFVTVVVLGLAGATAFVLRRRRARGVAAFVELIEAGLPATPAADLPACLDAFDASPAGRHPRARELRDLYEAMGLARSRGDEDRITEISRSFRPRRLDTGILEAAGAVFLAAGRWDLAEPLATELAGRKDGEVPGRKMALRIQGTLQRSDPAVFLAHARRSLPARFRVDRLLGKGGMGYVVLAREAADGPSVAIKVLSPTLASQPRFRKRFEREAQAVAALDHPNIVRVRGILDEGFPAFLMDHVEGEDLGSFMQRLGRVPAAEAVRILAQLADALVYAHERGVIHRDVKPGNVLIDGRGHVTLVDFGLVKIPTEEKLTLPGELMGSNIYMSPEQMLHAADVDACTDVFSFAVVAFELLHGKPPFDMASKGLYLGGQQPLARPDSDPVPDLTRALAAMLALHPADRPASLLDFLDDMSHELRRLGRG